MKDNKISNFTDRLFCGDSEKILKQIPDNSIDLVITSPPYNIGLKYDKYDDNKNWDEYYEWCKRWLAELYRILKEDGRFCLIHYISCGTAKNRQSPLMDLNYYAKQIGFKHHGIALWWDITLAKPTAWGSWLNASAPYINSPFESILILYKKYWKKLKKGKTIISKKEFMEACSGVWNLSPEKNRTHPAPFPESLSDRCIRLLSYEDDIILDPFMGSGTVCVSAKKLNRKYVGIDISYKYVELAIQRISQEYLRFKK